MSDEIKIYFLFFIICSMIGWMIEVTLQFIQLKKFVNRGYLIGPYCSIYGVGALLVTLILNRFKGEVVILFLMSLFTFAILEYTTSYMMEKIFKARWWDYGDKKFNINGRICINTLIPFGILGCIVIYIFNPIIFKLLHSINSNALNIIAIIVFVIYIIDNIISFKVIIKIKSMPSLQDNTEEISKKIRSILMNQYILIRRIVKAYPNFRLYIKKKVSDRIIKNNK